MTVPCAHCGLPSPEPENEGDLAFCCPGCHAVYYALQESGMVDFYAVRDRISPDKAQPAGRQHTDHAARFASESFLEEHTTLHADGTRSCELHLDGIHCAGCVWLVEKAPSALDGVLESSLNIGRSRLKVRWNPEVIGLDKIAVWLGQFGYTAIPLDSTLLNRFAEAEKALLFRVGVAWAVAANVMMLAIAIYSGMDVTEGPLFHAIRVLSGILTLISIVYCAPVFFRRAWMSVHPWSGFRRLSIDVPISIGITVGYLHSTYVTIDGTGDIWYDSVSVLIAALLTARWLQTRGRRMAGDAAERLITVLPLTAKRYLLTGEVEEVDSELLHPGDVVIVALGDVLPCDGIVTEGTTLLERAAITGESRPEAVGVGDQVHASEVNVGNPIKVTVTAIGTDTRVGKLLSWVQEGSNRQSDVVHLADAISGWFVFAILVASVLTGIVWWLIADSTTGLERVVALLVISCPCALGMATPLAMTMGMGRASREGIFIKHEDVIELVRRADLLLLDKTGTVTYGAMTLEPGEVAEPILQAVAALERGSNHPIAKAFSSWDTGAEVSDLTESPGKGLEGVVRGDRYRVGSTRWIPVSEDHITAVVSQGLTPVVVEKNGEIVGIVGVGDKVRQEGKEVISHLIKRGIHVKLISGDREELVENAALALGLQNQQPLKEEESCFREVFLGGQIPSDKLALVQRYQEAGYTVVMVGDGVNDAAALKAADVGIAVHGGSELNQVAGDVFLTRSGLEPILDLWAGSDEVMHIVKRNLIGSLLYNALGITAAAVGWATPLVAAVAMPISSLSVVGSSMLGRRFRANHPSSPLQPPLTPPPGGDGGR